MADGEEAPLQPRASLSLAIDEGDGDERGDGVVDTGRYSLSRLLPLSLNNPASAVSYASLEMKKERGCRGPLDCL